MRMTFRQVDWEFSSALRIAYQTRSCSHTVLVELRDGDLVGRGEAMGVSYHGETVQLLLEQLAEVSGRVTGGLSREALQEVLPAGGARNALDCALWDLEAKRSGRRAWEIAGIESVRPVITAYTLGIDTAEGIGAAAAAARRYSVLKLKLAGDGEDLARVALTRKARPDATIIVDANQAWSADQLSELAPRLAELGVTLIEQPMATGADHALLGADSQVPLCADESFQTAESLAAAAGKYQYLNIKLDKTGGLTAALECARLAREAGFKLMVGCMGGSSLAMAPAFIVAQLCDVVDLDAPLLAKADTQHAIRYEGSQMFPPDAALWG